MTTQRKEIVWSYGITTIPERLESTLPTSIHSLQRGGFPYPRLFVDGVDNPDKFKRFNLPITSRWPRIGAMQNWILALTELYYRNPKADRYVIFQDDILVTKNLRQYLEICRHPDDGYLNLYTTEINQMLAVLKANNNGSMEVGIGWFPSHQNGKGALGLVFNQAGTHYLLSSEYIRKKVLNPDRGHKNIDGGIITTMRQQGYIEYCHSPTLIQHIGYNSSLNNPPNAEAPLFFGEDYDALNFAEAKYD